MPTPPRFSLLIVRALFLKPVARRPWRFIITIAGVAIGVAAMLATWASSRAAVASMREGVIEVAGRARLEVTQPGGIYESGIAALRPLASDALIVPVLEEFVILPKLNDTARVLGVDFLLDRSVREFDWSAGAEPSPELYEDALQGRGALLPEAMARDLGLKAGDQFTILSRSRPTEIRILALFRPRALASAWNRTFLLDISWAQEIFGRVGRVDRVELLQRSNITIEDLESRARALAPPGATVAAPRGRADQSDGMVRSLEFNLTALSGISLIVGTVLVATTLATSVVQRRSILALLRSLGATNLQIATAILFEASTIGIVGGVAGVVAGALGSRLSLEGARTTVAAVIQGMPSSEIHIPWWAAAGGVVLGWVVSMTAAILPLREALKTPPVQGLRRERPELLSLREWRRAGIIILLLFLAAGALASAPAIGGMPYAALGSALALLLAVLVTAAPALDALARATNVTKHIVKLSLVIRAAVAALSAGRARAAWAAGAVAMAVALAISITTMVGSFRSTVVDYVNQTIRSDVWVRPRVAATGVHVGRLDPEIVNIAFQEFGTGVVDPFHETTAYCNKQPISLCGGVYAVIQRAAGLPMRDGRDPKMVFRQAIESGGVVVNEPFANKFNIKEGDRISIDVPGGKFEAPVAGVFYDYSRSQGMVVIDRAKYLSIYPDDGPREIALFLMNPAEAPAARARLVALLANRFDVDVLVNKEIREQAMQAFDRTFAITKALEMVARLIALVAVMTVLTALVDERKQDFALVRALGGSRVQVWAMIVTEGVCLGIVSVLSGLVFGLLVGVILVKIVNLQSFGWTMQLVPPWAAILSILISVTFMCAAAAFVPAWIASRRTARELLQDDVG